MSRADLVVRDEDHARFRGVLDQLRAASNTSFALLLTPSGQRIAMSGDVPGGDPTTMASLAAGNIATTEGLAALLGEEEFSALFHEGRRNNMYLSMVSGKLILLLVFDERSSLGLVRLRVDEYVPRLSGILTEADERAASEAASPMVSPLQQITDEDIESLFN